MKKVITDSDGDEAKFQKLMESYASENPMQAMQDAQAMQGAMSTEMISCLDGLKTKYDDLYTNDSETEVQNKLLEELKAMEDCKSSYVFMKMGMANR